MQVTITGRHVEIQDAVKDYIEQRADKLEKFAVKLTSARIVLSEQKYGYSAEVILLAKHQQIFAKENSPDLLTAVERVFRKTERQLKKYESQLKDIRLYKAK